MFWHSGTPGSPLQFGWRVLADIAFVRKVTLESAVDDEFASLWASHSSNIYMGLRFDQDWYQGLANIGIQV